MHKYLVPFSNLKEEVITAITWYYGSIIHYERDIARHIYDEEIGKPDGKRNLERIYTYYLNVKGERNGKES